MILSRKKLLSALSLPCSISDGFILISSADKGFAIAASDGDQACLVKVECDDGGKLSPVCVNAKTFKTAIEYGSEEIKLELDRDKLIYKSGKQKLTIPTLPAEHHNILKSDGRLLVINAALLASGLRKSQFSAARDSHREPLKSVRVKASATELVCESANGAEWSRYSAAAICADAKFVIPSEFVATLGLVLLNSGAELLVGKNTIRAESPTMSYTCKLMEDFFPNYDEPLAKSSFQEIGILARNEWAEAFKCIKALKEKNDTMLKVEVEFTAKQAELTSGDYSTQIEGNFKPAKISLNGLGFLNCLMACADEALIKLSVDNSVNAIRLDEALPDASYMIMECQLR